MLSTKRFGVSLCATLIALVALVVASAPSHPTALDLHGQLGTQRADATPRPVFSPGSGSGISTMGWE